MLELLPFTYRLRQPILTAVGSIAVREGFVLQLTQKGRHFAGECAPLPGFSRETLDACVARAKAWLQGPAATTGEAWLARARDLDELPALRSAAESIAIAIATHEGRTLDEWPAPTRTRILAHALVHDEASAQTAVAQGFRTLKIKVGARPLREDVQRVRAIRRAVGETITLRLDANCAWEFKEAQNALETLCTERIEFIEEPLRTNDPSGLATLRRDHAIPIAADENARDDASIRALLAADAVDVIVLKPAFCGGPLSSLALAQKAHAHGVSTIVTTSFDGPVGTQMTLELCARLPGRDRAHGVATGALFEDASAFQHAVEGTFIVGEAR